MARCNTAEKLRDKLGKGTWTEEQEDELRNLYMENQTNPQTNQDVIDWILENLIDQTRTRRSVIKKLKELGLIFKAPTKRSNKENARERVPKDFSEEEDEMLKQLWEEFCSTSDPMSVLMARMPRKRQKRSYVDRLLELGVIKNRDECRKRRQKSGANRTGSDNELSDKDSDSDSEKSGSDDARSRSHSPVNHKPAKRKEKKSKETSKKRPAKTVELSASQVAGLLVKAVENGFTEALKWVAENLEEVALDQEAEGFDPTGEGTPLVPISSESVEAMDSELFTQVLRGIGICPPSDEQETYWRIPSSLHHTTIRKRREIIMKAVNNELIIDTNEATQSESIATGTPQTSRAEESSDDDDLFDSLRKLRGNIEPIKSADQIQSEPRKRSRSEDSDDASNKNKMQKIDELDEKNGDDEDILSFAKRTLQQEDLPDTEDIFSALHKARSDDSGSDDNEDVVRAKPDKKKRRFVIDDDSD